MKKLGSSKLDDFETAYNDDFKFALDNRLILNWYPGRVIEYSRGGSILELGLGHGYSTIHFSKHFNRHVVLEGSKRIIQRFQTKFPKNPAEIINTYFEEFETNECFDVIVMGFVLEHVDNPMQILCKYRNFLRNDGSVFLAVPNGASLLRRVGYEAGMISDILELGNGDKALGHKRLFTLNGLKEIIRSAGYREIRTEGIFLKMMTTDQIKLLDISENVLQAMLKVGVKYPDLSVGILMEAKPAT